MQNESWGPWKTWPEKYDTLKIIQSNGHYVISWWTLRNKNLKEIPGNGDLKANDTCYSCLTGLVQTQPLLYQARAAKFLGSREIKFHCFPLFMGYKDIWIEILWYTRQASIPFFFIVTFALKWRMSYRRTNLIFYDKQFCQILQIRQIEKWTSILCFCRCQLLNKVLTF